MHAKPAQSSVGLLHKPEAAPWRPFLLLHSVEPKSINKLEETSYQLIKEESVEEKYIRDTNLIQRKQVEISSQCPVQVGISQDFISRISASCISNLTAHPRISMQEEHENTRSKIAESQELELIASQPSLSRCPEWPSRNKDLKVFHDEVEFQKSQIQRMQNDLELI